MEKRLDKSLKSILGLAIVYFCLAELSNQVLLITDYAGLLPLNSGFALAAMLVVPPLRSLTGIALGTLAVSLYPVFNLGWVNAGVSWQSFVPTFSVLLQAYIGFKIFRKWVSSNNNLGDDDHLLRFLKVVPLIAAINASLTVFVAQWIDINVQQSVILQWIVIWIGNTLSFILVLPVVLSLLELHNPLWKSRKRIIVFNFVVSLIVIFIICFSIRTFENIRQEDRFKILTNQTATLFQISLKEKELLQDSTAQMIVSSQEVTRQEFKQFVRGVSKNNAFIQVVEWLPKIEYEQREAYEQKQARYYGHGFTIKEAKGKGIIVSASKRDVYYPITYLEPEEGNDTAKGFDPSVSLGAQEVIKKAVISGRAQARGPIDIVRKSGFKSSFIVYKPVYQNFDGTKTLDPSEGKVIGFVNVVVRVPDFIATIVGPIETANFNLQWQDVETGKFYFDNSGETEGSFLFQHVVDIHISGRDMKLIFTPTQMFIDKTKTQVATLVMVTGLLFSGLFSILMLYITARASKIKREVKFRTRELEAVNEKLELLSNKDELTNLSNRRHFENALQAEFERSVRYKNSFALVILDIDHFKKVNDQFGHPCGDKVIIAVADYLINTSRSSDVLARIGGEEFALILPTQSRSQVISIVERIRIDLSNIKVTYEEHTVQITCSFGIALFDEQVKDVTELIKMADKALYEAKHAGRNTTKLFSK